MAQGTIVSARGPPEHRFYLVGWNDGQLKWILHKQFQVGCYHLIDNYFTVHFYLNRAGDLEVPWEFRCKQCNEQFTDDETLGRHVVASHTFPVHRGTVSYRKTECVVHHRFQETLPRVKLLR